MGGLVIGGLQEALDRRGRGRASRFVVIPAAAGLAVVGEVLRRRRARADEPRPPPRARSRSGKALGMSVAVTGLTAMISSGERKLADRVARVASTVLPGNESLWRPAGPRRVARRDRRGHPLRDAPGFGMIENREESVEPSFDLPPLSPTSAAASRAKSRTRRCRSRADASSGTRRPPR